MPDAPAEDREDALRRVLGDVQRRGGIGRRADLEAEIAHARRYVRRLTTLWPDVSLSDARPSGTSSDERAAFVDGPVPMAGDRVVRIADLGSGGGLPGIVIAFDLTSVEMHLVERRGARADLLRYAVHALGLGGHTLVHATDVRVATLLLAGTCQAVTARSFAPPLVVLDAAAPLVVPGGLVVLSEPPDHRSRWCEQDLRARGWDDLGVDEGIHAARRRPV